MGVIKDKIFILGLYPVMTSIKKGPYK